jgi:GntR family transcriptional regulator
MSDRIVASLRIEKNGVPIYVQIREQMLRLIGAGVAVAGEQLPTMRQLAVALKTDLNTVRHAYDELARAGAITVVKARGTFVAEGTTSPPSRQTSDQMDDLAYRTIAAATALGIEPRALARRILQLIRSRKEGT